MLRTVYAYITDEMSKLRQNLNNAKSLNIDYIKNRLYRFHFEFLSRAQLPPSTLDSTISEIGDKYEFSANIFNFDWLNPLQSILENMLISGHTRGFHLAKSMHSKDALIKLLNLSISFLQQKIPEAEI